MISILDGASKYCFYWRGDAPPPPEPDGPGQPRSMILQFSSESHARFLLQQLQQHAGFRGLAASDRSADPIRWSPDQILSHLARQLATGRLLVERRWRQMPAGPSNQISRVVVPRKTNTVDATTTADPPTFPPQHDPGSQAQTLADAADDGAPFCEECERARQQLASSPPPAQAPAPIPPPPPPPEKSFPSANHDAKAQAKTLSEAAASGVPFCEECEKARQQAAA